MPESNPSPENLSEDLSEDLSLDPVVPASNIQLAIFKLPKLTAFGVGIETNEALSFEEYEEAFQVAQQALLKETAGFEFLCQWLQNIEKTPSFNSKHSSLGLKNLAEKSYEDTLSNGVFIAAAIHSGFKFKTRNRSANVKFNMSEASIQALKDASNDQ